jgi:hypothetical protein
MLEIRPVLGRSEFSAFIRLPRRLYAGMPGFVPPLDYERRMLLDPARAPYGGNGESFRWLAWLDGRPVGRIAAQVDAVAIKAWGAPIGTFGALDTVDDPRVVSALIAAAAAKLCEKGMGRMRGPLTPNMNGEIGVQIEGQNNGSMLLMPWHPPYLSPHIEAAGLTKAKDVVCYAFTRARAIEEIGDNPTIAAADATHGYRFRKVDMRDLVADIDTMRRIYNEAWAGNWGFVPVSVAEAEHLAKGLRPIVNADAVVILEHDGEPVAAALIAPNLFEYIADMDGRLAPLNWMRLLWRARRERFKSGRLILFGVRPGTSGALLVPTMMFREVLRRALQYHFEVAEFGWILEDKTVILKALERNGGVLTRRHRIYEMALG